MIKAANSIKGKINTTQNLKGKTNTSIIREYPELENIEIKPTALASLATAVKITNAAIKQLIYIGLSQEQAEKCTTLSNWQALSDLGWKTGY